MTVFDTETIGQISEYMNSSHGESLVHIAVAATGDTTIEAATLQTFDGSGMDLRTSSPVGESIVRVAWLTPISERFEVRAQLVALLDRALDELSG
ncbi:MAG TPA: DUF2470 domain-containing protein [Microbacterium sp.]|nr:DUF2470 domain-containing protein [Microbacterium sp.]